MAGDPKQLMRLGKVSRAHGLRGEVVVKPDVVGSMTLLRASTAFLKPPDGVPSEVKILCARAANRVLLVQFQGCGNRDQADAFANYEVLMPRERLPALEKDEYYATDLVGLLVKDVSGSVLGRVESLFEAGAAPVLDVVGAKNFQVPLVDIFVKNIDVEAGEIIIEPPVE